MLQSVGLMQEPVELIHVLKSQVIFFIVIIFRYKQNTQIKNRWETQLFVFIKY